MNNKIIDASHCGSRKSISLDEVLFRLFVVSCKTEDRAVEQIKIFIRDNWGSSGLSRIVQRRVLAEVARPSLVVKVYGEDKYSQSELDF